MDEPIEISQNVKSALNRNAPVVALESTVIAHGLPGEKAIEAAKLMTEAVESEGAVAAIIGIIEGKIKVGLSDDEIKRLSEGKDVMKVSTREIASAVCSKRDGATTVAATMSISMSAGIPVMATGGIGGVHRGASETWDISADLWELVKTPSIVVCSGAKSILDLPATLEWMETHQIPVFGYGTDDFPAFYSAKSGLKVPKLDKPEDIIDLQSARFKLGQRSALVLAVPVPKKDAVNVDDAIEKAVAAAKEEGITGPALTPFLLARVQELSDGKAIAANLSLLKNNAKIAAQIACALTKKPAQRIGFH